MKNNTKEKSNNFNFRVMTFNIRFGTANDWLNSWFFRRQFVVNIIKKHSPDIIGIQESLPTQSKFLTKQLGEEYSSFGKGRYHNIPLKTFQKHESMCGETCRVFYKNKRLKIIKERTFWHSHKPDVEGSIYLPWKNNLPRVTTYGHFSTKGGRELLFFNTHYHWGADYIHPTNELHVKEIKKEKELCGNIPTILVGDFNLPPKCKTSRTFERKCGLIDIWKGRNKDEPSFHNFKGDKNPKEAHRIDWILCTKDIDVEKTFMDKSKNVFGHYPSDHYPIIANLSI